ncbi:MAG TPA: hypothetical protein VL156_11545 [Terriglobales bacterium]|nr:hypothetical protein [Terriglobales bacterium]
MTVRLDKRTLFWFGLATSVAAASSACLIAYAGFGMVYGAYVGLSAHVADLRVLQIKGTRALQSGLLLQPLVTGLLWIALDRAATDRDRITLWSRTLRVCTALVLIDLGTLGILFVLGQLGFGPVVDLVRIVDRLVGVGL